MKYMNYQKMFGQDGERDCTERWEAIKPELPKSGVVMDVGSSEGYFPLKIIEETNNLIISVEGNSQLAQHQRRWMIDRRVHGRGVVCYTKMTGELAKQLYETCEFFDVILLLSCLHWMPDHRKVLDYLSHIAGKLIVEIPSETDIRACGQYNLINIGDRVGYLRACTGRDVRLLAEVKAHTSTTRDLYVVEGDQYRNPIRAYMNDTFSRRKQYQIQWLANNLFFNVNNESRKWTPGVNARTLAVMRCIFPEPDWWYDNAVQKLSDVRGGYPLDCEIWNLLAVNGGVKWIDLHEQPPRRPMTDCLWNIKTEMSGQGGIA